MRFQTVRRIGGPQRPFQNGVLWVVRKGLVRPNGEKNRRTTEAVSKRGALGGEKGLGQTVEKNRVLREKGLLKIVKSSIY